MRLFLLRVAGSRRVSRAMEQDGCHSLPDANGPTQRRQARGIHLAFRWHSHWRSRHILVPLSALTRPAPDVLGVSSLVDVINHRYAAGATASTVTNRRSVLAAAHLHPPSPPSPTLQVLGPFHVNHDVMVPMWGNISEGQAGAVSFVSGKVLDTEGRPVRLRVFPR